MGNGCCLFFILFLKRTVASHTAHPIPICEEAASDLPHAMSFALKSVEVAGQPLMFANGSFLRLSIDCLLSQSLGFTCLFEGFRRLFSQIRK